MRTVFFSVLMLGWMAGLGCSHSNGPLIADTRSPIADVPVPAGFTMTGESTSNVDPTSKIRIVDHDYKGSGDYLQVVAFYHDTMPQKGWMAGPQMQARGNEITLEFSNDREECMVTVWKGTLDTHVRVRINPRHGK